MPNLTPPIFFTPAKIQVPSIQQTIYLEDLQQEISKRHQLQKALEHDILSITEVISKNITAYQKNIESHGVYLNTANDTEMAYRHERKKGNDTAFYESIYQRHMKKAGICWDAAKEVYEKILEQEKRRAQWQEELRNVKQALVELQFQYKQAYTEIYYPSEKDIIVNEMHPHSLMREELLEEDYPPPPLKCRPYF